MKDTRGPMCLETASVKRARKPNEPAKIGVRHILVKYAGAKRADAAINRTREEACLRALQAHDKLGGSKNLDLCLCLGTGFLAKNTHDSALSWFKRAVGQAPANREAIAGAARAAELAGKHGVAVEYYRKLVEVEPGNQTARNYLAKHDSAGKNPPPPEEPGDLLPVGKKSP